MATRCTCLRGDHDHCGYCVARVQWEESLTDAQRGELALDFLDSLTTAYGVLRGEPVTRGLWLGREATVEFDGMQAFGDYLAAKYAVIASKQDELKRWAA